MLLELLQAFGLIFVAEMGDKTQILAMAFATKYKVRNVILGIFIGSLLNHALAVWLGANLSRIIPLNTLSIIAGFSFVIFALWSLKIDEEDENSKKSKYGPTITVAIAFFIGELGDKTQLAAIALSTDAQFPLFILMGTVTAMVFTGILGIFVGIKLGSKIDDFYIKVGASIIFFIFGYIKLFSSLPSQYLSIVNITAFTVLLVYTGYMLIKPTLVLRKIGSLSYYQRVASKLHDYYSDMYQQLEGICLGENHCGNCGGNNCLVGYTKNIIRNAQENKEFEYEFIKDENNIKSFSRSKVLESLKLTIELLENNWQAEEFKEVHKVRMNFENIMYNKTISASTYEEYLEKLNIIDEKLSKLLK